MTDDNEQLLPPWLRLGTRPLGHVLTLAALWLLVVLGGLEWWMLTFAVLATAFTAVYIVCWRLGKLGR